jgi:hypothetical protein
MRLYCIRYVYVYACGVLRPPPRQPLDLISVVTRQPCRPMSTGGCLCGARFVYTVWKPSRHPLPATLVLPRSGPHPTPPHPPPFRSSGVVGNGARKLRDSSAVLRFYLLWASPPHPAPPAPPVPRGACSCCCFLCSTGYSSSSSS